MEVLLLWQRRLSLILIEVLFQDGIIIMVVPFTVRLCSIIGIGHLVFIHGLDLGGAAHLCTIDG